MPQEPKLTKFTISSPPTPLKRQITGGPIIGNNSIRFKDIPKSKAEQNKLLQNWDYEQAALARHVDLISRAARNAGNNTKRIIDNIPFVNQTSAGSDVRRWFNNQAQAYTKPIKDRQTLIEQSRRGVETYQDLVETDPRYLRKLLGIK